MMSRINLIATIVAVLAVAGTAQQGNLRTRALVEQVSLSFLESILCDRLFALKLVGLFVCAVWLPCFVYPLLLLLFKRSAHSAGPRSF